MQLSGCATAEAYCTREWAYCGGAMAVNRLGHVAIRVDNMERALSLIHI